MQYILYLWIGDRETALGQNHELRGQNIELASEREKLIARDEIQARDKN